ncbi:hypothetical protein VIGAN_04130200 [Vigna angularis var. angularis]|uniref:Protein kinase domain-containing protein n=1 Tax=Vigna angularis var. angularis TaxID=157739 RepID=A0A0S3RTT7_PHAAN|nr:hypothetical protein VIGAN_04130200 [Vigna angularis var. angularis]
MGSKGMNELEAEITILSKVRHMHLVAFLGHCIEGNEKLLVYEYMPQWTLTTHLLSWHENDSAPLTWKQRVIIALDVARGVEYLHRLAQQSFTSQRLKPSNILLGDDMRDKVADFGLPGTPIKGRRLRTHTAASTRSAAASRKPGRHQCADRRHRPHWLPRQASSNQTTVNRLRGVTGNHAHRRSQRQPKLQSVSSFSFRVATAVRRANAAAPGKRSLRHRRGLLPLM